jgi:hypothetical protein
MAGKGSAHRNNMKCIALKSLQLKRNPIADPISEYSSLDKKEQG